MEIGGGFAARIPIYLEPVRLAILSKNNRTPGQNRSRTAQRWIRSHRPTPGSYIKVKNGANKYGNFTPAAQA